METPHPNEIKRLLVDLAIVRSVCELNVLVFLHRHPRILLTREQLAEFVSYPFKDIVKHVRFLLALALANGSAVGARRADVSAPTRVPTRS